MQLRFVWSKKCISCYFSSVKLNHIHKLYLIIKSVKPAYIPHYQQIMLWIISGLFKLSGTAFLNAIIFVAGMKPGDIQGHLAFQSPLRTSSSADLRKDSLLLLWSWQWSMLFSLLRSQSTDQ